MTAATDLIRQTAHFDDQDIRFEVLTAVDGRMFVTDETYFSLARDYDDLAPLSIDPATGLRVMDWEVNFDDATCTACGHPDHSARLRGACDAWVSNGWTQHGCHCDGI